MRESAVFYEIQPGESLAKIADRNFSIVPGNGPRQRIASLLARNPQIKNPDRIAAGEIIYLGSNAPLTSDLKTLEADRRDFISHWKRADPGTRRIVRMNFDVLEWLASRKDSIEFLNSLGNQSRPVLEAVQEFKLTGAIPMEIWNLSVRLKQMIRVRKETIETMRRLQLSISRQPVLVFSYTKNSLYPASKTLVDVLNFANRIKLGQRLTYLEIGLEGVKVLETAYKTQSVKSTARQVGRGSAKIVGGAVALKAAERLCRITVQKGPRGWLVCGIALAAAVSGGTKVGALIGDELFGRPEYRELPGLP